MILENYLFHFIISVLFLITTYIILKIKNIEINKYKTNIIEKDKEIIVLNEQIKQIEELKNIISQLNIKIQELTNENSRINVLYSKTQTELSKEKEFALEKESLLNETKEKLSNTFKALSFESLESNNKNFLDLAKTVFEKLQENAKSELDKKHNSIDEIIKPVKETLKTFDEKLNLIEKERASSFSSLNEQIKNLLTTNTELKSETGNLVQALKTPQVKGRWGEEQLKKVVEIAGMLNYCDFEEQNASSDGKLRADLIVKLPGGTNIIVDAKVSTHAYMDSLNFQDEDTKLKKLKDHARQVKDHINLLSRKSYWEQYKPTPEFVVMFIPGENFFSAALQADPTLIEEGVKHKVILASPTTLISLLRVIHYGWKQESITQNAKKIAELGKELYDRLSNFCERFNELGVKINQTSDAYNNAVSSMESRLLVTGRKIENLIISSKEIPDTVFADRTTKKID